MADGRRNTELTEMSASLRTFASKGNPSKEQQFQRRQLFQRVIHHVTIGIDMSPLFSDVIMNAHTTDMVGLLGCVETPVDGSRCVSVTNLTPGV
jgi:hypothetical protein